MSKKRKRWEKTVDIVAASIFALCVGGFILNVFNNSLDVGFRHDVLLAKSGFDTIEECLDSAMTEYSVKVCIEAFKTDQSN